jgi:hypothetical protein
MSNDNIEPADTANTPSYLARVMGNDSAKKGLAAAVAGVLVAVVSEALWPST